uniref:hypothetical protein n=1 Tax=Halothiobacillus sp. TaxID=1891311 RepID=UPI00262BB3FB
MRHFSGKRQAPAILPDISASTDAGQSTIPFLLQEDEMAESIPFSIRGDIVGYSAMDVCATGMNFYGPKGFFSPAAVTKSVAY